MAFAGFRNPLKGVEQALPVFGKNQENQEVKHTTGISETSRSCLWPPQALERLWT